MAAAPAAAADDEAADAPAGPTADGRWPAELFADADDRTVGLTRAELNAVAALRGRLAETPPAVADDAEATAFAGLIRDPEFYRGRSVRVFGEARGIVDLPGGRGVELWVFPPDADNQPIRVVANRADGLPRGARLAEGVPVRADGVFYKLYGYNAALKDGPGLNVAPLVVADAAERARTEAAVPQTPAELPWVVLGAIAAALTAGGLLVWRWRADDRAFERKTLDRLSAAADGEGETLEFAADDSAPEAFLAGMTAEAAAARPDPTDPASVDPPPADPAADPR